MWVTCYTDASWSPETCSGGWAYSLTSDQGRCAKSGPCPPWVTCNNTAEFAAIVAGIYRAVREWEGVEGVSVRTDSAVAITYLRFYPGKVPITLHRVDWLVIRDKLHRILRKYSCKVKLTHVKGHQSSRTRPAYMNNKVDDLSRMARHGSFVDK